MHDPSASDGSRLKPRQHAPHPGLESGSQGASWASELCLDGHSHLWSALAQQTGTTGVNHGLVAHMDTSIKVATRGHLAWRHPSPILCPLGWAGSQTARIKPQPFRFAHCSWAAEGGDGTAQFREDGADNSFDYKGASCLSLHLVIPLQVASTAELMGSGSILKAEKRTVCAGRAGGQGRVSHPGWPQGKPSHRTPCVVPVC